VSSFDRFVQYVRMYCVRISAFLFSFSSSVVYIFAGDFISSYTTSIPIITAAATATAAAAATATAAYLLSDVHTYMIPNHINYPYRIDTYIQ
jgi:hypothetical protein